MGAPQVRREFLSALRMCVCLLYGKCAKELDSPTGELKVAEQNQHVSEQQATVLFSQVFSMNLFCPS